MVNFNVIISPSDQMLLHTELLFRSFRNSKIKDYFPSLTVGPEQISQWNLSKLKKLQPALRLNPYSASEHGFKPPYLGGLQRWKATDEADVIMLVDADVLVCGDLTEVVERCRTENKVMGVRNIGSPFRFKQTSSVEEWTKLEKKFGVKFEYVNHNGVEISQFDPKHYLVPTSYFNYGFVLVPSTYKAAIIDCLPDVVKKLEMMEKNFWNGEMAFCLTLEILKIPLLFMEQKYNYPDRIEFFTRSPCNDIRVLHMVRKTIKTQLDIERIQSVSKNAVELFIKKQVTYSKAIRLL